MGELQTEYGDRIQVNIIGAVETAAKADELAVFGFTDLQHGLVVFDAAGEAQTKIPGHRFGKPEIQAAIEKALAE